MNMIHCKDSCHSYVNLILIIVVTHSELSVLKLIFDKDHRCRQALL